MVCLVGWYHNRSIPGLNLAGSLNHAGTGRGKRIGQNQYFPLTEQFNKLIPKK